MLKQLNFTRVSRCLAITALAAGLLLPHAAFAQSGIFVVPWLTAEEVYDDNIFFDTEDEISDFVTRLSAQLDVGFESETLYWQLGFQNDSEWYNDLSELDSSTARQFGTGRIEYQPNRRWTLAGDLGYTKTNSAQDITLTPGGEIPGAVGRVEAERWFLAAGAEYQFTSNLSGDFFVSWTQNEIIDSSLNEVLAGDIQVEQILSPTRSLVYGYEYRNYEFQTELNVGPAFELVNEADSNTAWVGLTQALSETSDLELRVGPRVSDGDLEPYIYLDWQRGYARGNTVIRAVWDETTLLGEVGILDSRSIQAIWTHEFTSEFEVVGSVGYAYLSETGFSTDIASFNVSGIYQFNPYIFMTARYAFNEQQEESFGIQSGRITHNVLSLSITFTRPRRDPDRSPS